ncbi:MAG: electron transfer flavoprotein subunit beta/FixA family protein [Candidatus Cloacimonetes bacterium]|nr:electron transfer flavoprotein subunit beta/FixA family protein [Candidatus Cloacimonadota bacterium]
MKIYVCCKQVPDVAMTIQIKDGKFISEGMNYVLNAYDASCVEEALVLKEKYGAEVTLVLIGDEAGKEALRKGLAMGADNAFHISDPALNNLGSQAAAKVLQAFFKGRDFDFILTGKQAQDSDMGLAGGILSGLLNLPYVTNAVGLDVQDKMIVVKRQGDEGVEVLHMPMPSLITCSNDMNDPRIPSLKGIMASKKKPMEQVSLTDLGLSADEVLKESQKSSLKSFGLPPARKAGAKIEGDAQTLVATLMEKLTKEAKVL